MNKGAKGEEPGGPEWASGGLARLLALPLGHGGARLLSPEPTIPQSVAGAASMTQVMGGGIRELGSRAAWWHESCCCGTQQHAGSQHLAGVLLALGMSLCLLPCWGVMCCC